jgi:putative glycosyltransferase
MVGEKGSYPVHTSIVTTLYYSAPYVEEFYQRIVADVTKITPDFEIIFVDDGSPDDALQRACDLVERDRRVKVIELSRNFGHTAAMMAGIQHTQGDLVFVVDSDLEEPPELYSTFYDSMMKSNDRTIDMVYGVQIQRHGNFIKRVSGELFYKVAPFLLSVQVPKNAVWARLMRRRYVQALLMHHETELYMLGLFSITGFHQMAVPVEKKDKGTTTYTLAKRLMATLTAITSFSDTPLYMILYGGLVLSLIAGCVGLYLLIEKLVFQVPYLSGWVSLILVVIFFNGLLFASIGIVGLYIARIFREVKHRPLFIVRDIHVNMQETPQDRTIAVPFTAKPNDTSTISAFTR